MRLNKFIPVLAIVFSVIVFFYPFVLKQQLPIPSDTIVGLYYPFRDLYAQTNPNGLPYKNFLITDPVRQQYPWKSLVSGLENKFEVPVWNPYEMGGTPLMANFQSSVLYPLNLLFLFSPFYLYWSVYILIGPLFAGIFLYLYLRNLKLDARAAVFGAITWMFCGFSIAWMEWGVILHTALWLPLILLSVDKFFEFKKNHRRKLLWAAIWLFSLTFSFFAGHLQTFFYLFLFSGAYLFRHLYSSKTKLKDLSLFIFLFITFIFISFIQWFSTLQFILESNRALDQVWYQPGWFIPFQNLIQFLAPDFFGNPATLNYYGVWNYAEFIGYIGLSSLIFALYAIIQRRDKILYFYIGGLLVSLLFALQNPISTLPFVLHIPFLSTAQPTRLIFIIDFSLSILAAFGLDHFLKHKSKIWIPAATLGISILFLWIFVFFGNGYFPGIDAVQTAKNNLKLPTVIFLISTVLLLSLSKIKNVKLQNSLIFFLFVIVFFDLFRFGWKFTPFTKKDYLFPDTPVTKFLQKQNGIYRVAATDSRILPPNFSIMYKIQSIEGYDPLYLTSYAELIAANERSDHSIRPPFGFNRIITPRNVNSQIIDLLNVKYILSLSDLNNPKFKKVLQNGETRVYENLKVYPRAFFVKNIISVDTQEEAAHEMFDLNTNLRETAVVLSKENQNQNFVTGYSSSAQIIKYSPNEILIHTNGDGGFLVFADVNYPIWKADIDGKNSIKIYQTDLALRGVYIPEGKHVIRFKASVLAIGK